MSLSAAIGRQRGVALITAMLIVALATMLTGAAVRDFHLDQRRTEAVLYSDLGTGFALGAEAWAGRILIEDAEDNTVDHPGEVWATNLPPLPIDGGTVDGALIDLQGRFNLNNLVDAGGNSDPVAVEQMERLLAALELERRWAGLIADWIDADISPNFPDGAEDSTYLGQVPPYRPPNTLITSTSELMALPEMDLDTYRTLAPHVTALPAGTAINVNTATVPVLMSLSDDLTASDAAQIQEDRPEDGYETVAELQNVLPADISAPLTVGSRYFRLAVRVNIGSTELTMYSLLEREGSGAVRTLLRSFGTE
ncbi:MAG: type II secretion system minor pseudopilin GspK [Gammaproteobacteria bacterium]|jgi:general secretion pathway protein K